MLDSAGSTLVEWGRQQQQQQHKQIRDIHHRPSCREKAGDVRRKIFGDAKPTTTPPLRPPWTHTGTHTLELNGQKTGDTVLDHAITMQTLEKDLDSYDTTIYTDGSVMHTAVAASLSPLATQVTLESTVSAPSRPTNDARLSKQKRMRYELAMNSHRRMSSSTRCASFQIVCQHSNENKISNHPSKLPNRRKRDS